MSSKFSIAAMSERASRASVRMESMLAVWRYKHRILTKTNVAQELLRSFGSFQMHRVDLNSVLLRFTSVIMVFTLMIRTHPAQEEVNDVEL